MLLVTLHLFTNSFKINRPRLIQRRKLACEIYNMYMYVTASFHGTACESHLTATTHTRTSQRMTKSEGQRSDSQPWRPQEKRWTRAEHRSSKTPAVAKEYIGAPCGRGLRLALTSWVKVTPLRLPGSDPNYSCLYNLHNIRIEKRSLGALTPPEVYPRQL